MSVGGGTDQSISGSFVEDSVGGGGVVVVGSGVGPVPEVVGFGVVGGGSGGASMYSYL